MWLTEWNKKDYGLLDYDLSAPFHVPVLVILQAIAAFIFTFPSVDKN